MVRTMPTAIHRRIAEPQRAMDAKTDSWLSSGANPRSKARTRAISSTAWPAIRSGPVRIPRTGLSLIVTVSRGPGMRAPDRAIRKDEKKSVRKGIILPAYICFSMVGKG